jgi:hypothetical protein
MHDLPPDVSIGQWWWGTAEKVECDYKLPMMAKNNDRNML